MYKTCSYIKYGLMRLIIKYLRSYMVGTIINNNIIFLELFSLCTRKNVSARVSYNNRKTTRTSWKCAEQDFCKRINVPRLTSYETSQCLVRWWLTPDISIFSNVQLIFKIKPI